MAPDRMRPRPLDNPPSPPAVDCRTGAGRHRSVSPVRDESGDLDLKSLQYTLLQSARKAGTRAVASGKWLSEWVVDNAPRIPVRDAATLSQHHDGLTGDALAKALIDAAGRVSGTVGGTVGALAGMSTMFPPGWLTLPVELAVETGAVAVIELKLTAELHEVYGYGITGTPKDRGLLIVKAWADRRGITPASVAKNRLSTRAVRDEVIRQVRRRLVRRLGRNLSSVIPLFVGAAAGAYANRKATRDVGDAIADDLRNQRRSP